MCKHGPVNLKQNEHVVVLCILHFGVHYLFVPQYLVNVGVYWNIWLSCWSLFSSRGTVIRRKLFNYIMFYVTKFRSIRLINFKSGCSLPYILVHWMSFSTPQAIIIHKTICIHVKIFITPWLENTWNTLHFFTPTKHSVLRKYNMRWCN